jgi:hypothetical protein
MVVIRINMLYLFNITSVFIVGCGSAESDKNQEEILPNHNAIEIDHIVGIQPNADYFSICQLDELSQSIGTFKVTKMVSYAVKVEDDRGNRSDSVATDVSFEAVEAYKDAISDVTLRVSGGNFYSDTYGQVVQLTGDHELRLGGQYLMFLVDGDIIAHGLYQYDEEKNEIYHHNHPWIKIADTEAKRMIGSSDCASIEEEVVSSSSDTL